MKIITSLEDRLAYHNNFKSFDLMIQQLQPEGINLQIPIYLKTPMIAEQICIAIKSKSCLLSVDDNETFTLFKNNNLKEEAINGHEIESVNSESAT